MTARMWLNLIGALLIIGLLGTLGYIWKDYKARGAKIEAMESVSNVTSEATDALTETTAATQQVEVIVRQERAQRDSAFQELKQRDQTVNDWANQPLPASLRDLDGGSVNGSENHPAGSGKPDSDN